MDSKNNISITNYNFLKLSDQNSQSTNSRNVTNYNLNHIENKVISGNPGLQKVIKSERTYAEQTGFIFSNVVEEFRGIKDQKQKELDQLIIDEINKREIQIRDKWEQDGFTKGQLLGHEEVLKISEKKINEQLDVLKSMIEEIKIFKSHLLHTQKTPIINLIKSLTKWIILKEVKNDNDFLNRLLEKLILELGLKENLLIKVRKEDLSLIPRALEVIEAKIGKLTNVRIETDQDLLERGIIIESQNGILDGSLEAQFQELDKLFELMLENDHVDNGNS